MNGSISRRSPYLTMSLAAIYLLLSLTETGCKPRSQTFSPPSSSLAPSSQEQGPSSELLQKVETQVCAPLAREKMDLVVVGFTQGVLSLADTPCRELARPRSGLHLGRQPTRGGLRYSSVFDQAAYLAQRLDSILVKRRIAADGFPATLRRLASEVPTKGGQYSLEEIGPNGGRSVIKSNVDPEGSLTFMIESVADGVRGPIAGKELFANMIAFHGDGVKEIHGVWVYETNLDMFRSSAQELLAGRGKTLATATPEELREVYQEAARGTWTGKQAAQYGFTEVREVQVELSEAGDIREAQAIFRKPVAGL